MFKWIINLIKGNKAQNTKTWGHTLRERDSTQPINFGHKSIWAAVKTEDTEQLLSILNLKKMEKTDWVEGTIKAYNGYVFVLPPIRGWTLISGWGLPAPDHEQGVERTKKFLNHLSQNFEEAQLFCAIRTVDGAIWMRSINGKTERFYSIGDSNAFIEGIPTEIEKQWDLLSQEDLKNGDDEIYEKKVRPDVDHVLEVAENWSINPMKLEEEKNVGTFGYTGRLSIK